MKIREIYELAVKKGMEQDPRGLAAVQKVLEKSRKRFEEAKEEEKREFDQDSLFNPYADTRLLVGDPEREVRRVLAGIDMEVGEVLLADRLGEKGQPIDLIIAHHPEGKAMAALHEVMHLQEDVLAKFGVPINVAQGILSSRINEVRRNMMPFNHNRAVDAARLLGLSMMCIHTPADNHVHTFVQNLMDEKQPETLGDVLKLLKSIPEYEQAVQYNAGPTIIVGSKERRAGKIMVDMTGGTSGSEDAYSKLAVAGVGTLIVMHMGEKHRKEAEKNHINVIIAGHMASDSLGLNLILDELAAAGIEIIPCAGLLRVRRN
ncbi:NIF3 (NGG1p interacting factor 3)-like protein [Desulfurispora thermophila]|uniref:NIF3 (NGG1p interacting factor 3)-like protein n=1 Tax=Desulfurispora thermophila TaxID=265470 RepID=UPI00038201BA|nr:NIF3 (NGG1p interacting factor 3)-like protein [Desulfurispora thermophila]